MNTPADNNNQRAPMNTGNNSGRGGGRRVSFNQGQRGSGAARYRNPRNRNSPAARGRYGSKTFKGETSDLNEHVFQTMNESKDPSQFKHTMDALQRYSDKTYGADLRNLFNELELPTIERPQRPEPDEVEEIEMDIYREKVKRYVKEQDELNKSLRSLFAVIWGQCSLSIITKLTSMVELEGWRQGAECHNLLKAIREIVMNYEHQRSPYTVLYRQLRFFYTYVQKETQDLHKYYEVSQIMTDNIERYGGVIGSHPAYIKEIMSGDDLEYGDDDLDEDVVREYEVKAHKKFLAIAFLVGARRDQYGDLVTELENDYLKGHDYFPNTITEAYNLMSNYGQRSGFGTVGHGTRNRVNAIGFLNAGSKVDEPPVAGTNGTVHPNVECWKCGKKGHFSNKCPNERTVSLLQSGGNHEPANRSDNDGNAGDSNPEYVHENETFDHFGFLQVSYSLLQKSEYKLDGLSKEWVLLDTQSNCDVFCNKRLLSNIRNHDGPGLTLHSNGGQMQTQSVGDVRGYGTVWFAPSSLANILSFANVRKRFPITMRTGPNDEKPTITVHKPNGKTMDFVEHDIGLYVHDTTSVPKLQVDTNDNLNNSYDYSFLTTIESLASVFSKREQKSATEAYKLYVNLGRPPCRKFYDIIQSNKIQGCMITIEDAKRAMHIHGVDPAHVKGISTRTRSQHIQETFATDIPDHIQKFHMRITLCVDIMFVHNKPYFHTIARKIQFRTIEMMPSRGYKVILSCLQRVINLYEARGFSIAKVHGDPEFSSLRDSILPVQMHIVAQGEHVPEIERSVRTVKDRARVIIQSLPYQKYRKTMITYLLHHVIRLLNVFPGVNNVCKEHSPRSIITGIPDPSVAGYSLSFGEYVQVHNVLNITNTTAARSTDAIALTPSNANGGYFFMSLTTGKRISRYAWTPCVLTQDIIERVHFLATTNDTLIETEGADSSQIDNNNTTDVDNATHETNDGTIEEQAENQADNQDHDENVDQAENPDQEQAEQIMIEQEIENMITDDEDNSVNSEEDSFKQNATTQNNIENQRSADEGMSDGDNDNLSDESKTQDEHQRSDADTNKLEHEVTNEASNVECEVAKMASNEEASNEEETRDNENNGDKPEPVTNEKSSRSEIDQAMNLEVNRYNLRSRLRKTRDNRFNKSAYNFLIAKRENMEIKRKIKTTEDYRKQFKVAVKEYMSGDNEKLHEVHINAIGLCMTQMSAAKGIRTYGNKALTAMAKEYAQLNDLNVFTPRWVKSLSREERRSALHVIDLIKEKRCGKIKGRTVVDGRGQRGEYEKHETSSSALTLEAFMASLTIDAAEGRDVAISDIAGAYLKADQPDFVLIKMRGPAVDAILQVDENKYKKYIVIENNEKVLYMELLKAMYGTLTAAILWYKLFSSTLVGMGFIINAYDSCVANCEIAGSQFTICWYVDDLKLSHISEQEVTRMLVKLESIFGKMSTTRGDRHTYLGMEFCIKNKLVHIQMTKYLEECIKAYGELISSAAATPATKDLMEVNEDSEMLNDTKRVIFHHVVQKLLHVCKRARLDLQVAVSFLCTRVRAPTLEDWKKLRRMLCYIHGTIKLERIISMSNFNRMDIFVDASHGVHTNMRGHTGGCVSMGLGLLHARSSKQTINTKSSTETELIGCSEYLPYPIWMIHFLEEQGYYIEEKVLHQDNQSTMKMLKNGRKSCGKKSRHLNIRFFWTSDRMKEMSIEVEHCPTTRMLGDFFTKPLQGTLFRTMRDVVQGVKSYDALVEYSDYRKGLENEKRKEEKNLDRSSLKEDKNCKCGTHGEDRKNTSLTCRKERVDEIKRYGEKPKDGDGVNYENKREIRTYVEAVKNGVNKCVSRIRGSKRTILNKCKL